MTYQDDSPDETIIALQREYLRDAPARLAELRKDLAAFQAGEPDALESLRARFHRLAGSGGSYGFPRVSEISREMEQRILTPPAPTPQEADIFEEAIEGLKSALDAAASDFEPSVPTGKVPGLAGAPSW